jgi:dynein heavy chain
VEKVKGFTTLFDLRDDDWNLDVEIIIRDFFLDKSAEVLGIYFADVTLTAFLGFPTVPIKDMTYFFKDSPDIITPENFHEVVTFGTTSDNIEGTMLNVLEHVYAPIFFNETSWPDSILCLQIHINFKDDYKTRMNPEVLTLL